MRTGISIYFGSGIAVSERVIARAAQAGVDYAFTSMHIPEEDGAALAGDARHLLGMLREAGIGAIVDVGPETCAKLGCESLEGLADLGVTHLRLDYGFTAAETASLARTFHIVCNASTVTKADIASWRAAGADLARFTACHNYYPKPGTGLDLDEVRRMNDLLSAQGFEVLGFVPGDGVLRGPLHEGLPTIEEHRARRTEIARNMLELGISGGCDGVLVGDVDLTASGWEALSQVAAGYVDIRCRLEEGYRHLFGQIHHDRPDSSTLLFRSQESRAALRSEAPIAPDAGAGLARRRGSISIANTGYLRYEGEIEIARADLDGDERQNVIGWVIPEDLELVDLARRGFGLRFRAE
ncbi:MAG: MupG family TIM beta-alpha barrel fold protein [Collinsella sp.]|nr:MupG family TIM beta-alpha barrel fold protein [Collinsella sp.]